MKTIAFFLEEPSSRAFLEELLKLKFPFDPQDIAIAYRVFEGKQDLEKSLEKRLKHWNTPDTTFVVMMDQDSGDCETVKNRVKTRCSKAGRDKAIVRIACHELESFFLGDLWAIENGLGIKDLSKRQNQTKFREPDKLKKPSQEIGMLIRNKSKRKFSYLKIEGARRITPYMNPLNNRSHSFGVLYRTLVGIFEGTDKAAAVR
jgi:hypothetical protein